MTRGLLHAPMMPEVGEPAPPFDLVDDEGRAVRLADYRGRWLVLYFYPKDETPGCVAEGCAFRDEHAEFARRGVAILGVSRDSVESHRAFRAARRFPFPLASDRRGHAVRAYGVMGWFGIPRRVSFLVDPTGVVRHVHDSRLRPTSHVRSMLDALDAFGVAQPSAPR